MDIDWNAELVEQLDRHWQNQLRPRMDGLTDHEYFWEPVAGPCWNVRRRGATTPASAPGSGDYTVDFAFPQPVPPPVTTIAWRLAHIIVGCFAMRNAAHFGGPPADYQTHPYAGTAAQALGQLDDAYAGWVKGVRSLGADGLRRPCGPAEPYPRRPWPCWCCTSTARSSTTAPRSPYCATCTRTGSGDKSRGACSAVRL